MILESGLFFWATLHPCIYMVYKLLYIVNLSVSNTYLKSVNEARLDFCHQISVSSKHLNFNTIY